MSKNYVLAIKKDKDFLRERSDELQLGPLSKPKVIGLINNLKDTLKANKNLVALAASQIGTKERVFCIKFANGDIRAFINPIIIRTEGIHLSREISIGLDDVEYIVPRATDIYASYQTPDMIDTCDVNKFSGPVAEVFQQMNDLLNGVLLEDIGLEVLPGWDKASDEEKQEIISMYFDTLKQKEQHLTEVINNDPETKELSEKINKLEEDVRKAVEFNAKLEKGEIETVELTEEEKEMIKANREKLSENI